MYRTSTASAALALLVLVAEGRAQQGPVSLGVLVGGVVADQTGEDVFVPHDIFGYLGGAFVRYDLSDRFSLEGEVLYVTKGGEENIDNSPEEAADRLDLAYFEFPLLLRFSLSTRGVRPSLFVGPSIAVETSCEYDAVPEGVFSPVPCPDAGISTKSTDVGVAFGAGLDLPVGAGSLVIDGRGIVGLGTIDDSDDGLDYRNRILALSVGYRFPL